jgi:hypothetical protein
MIGHQMKLGRDIPKHRSSFAKWQLVNAVKEDFLSICAEAVAAID